MEQYFNIRYEFDRKSVITAIDKQLQCRDSNYICVADGVILNTANRNREYLKVVNDGMFSICDSGFVPIYIKWLYGYKRKQYCGSEIFKDIICCRKYKMIFIGTSKTILDGLRQNIKSWNPDITSMTFLELPFKKVEEFDYPTIAQTVTADKAEIIWIALGAPKQEYFMNRLKPYLPYGVMIGVGAAFKFFSGIEAKRAPKWMIKLHMEFIYRIYREPRKQLKRCGWIIVTLPWLLYHEWKHKKINS